VIVEAFQQDFVEAGRETIECLRHVRVGSARRNVLAAAGREHVAGHGIVRIERHPDAKHLGCRVVRADGVQHDPEAEMRLGVRGIRGERLTVGVDDLAGGAAQLQSIAEIEVRVRESRSKVECAPERGDRVGWLRACPQHDAEVVPSSGMAWIELQRASVRLLRVLELSRFLVDVPKVIPGVDVLRRDVERAPHQGNAFIGSLLLVTQDAEEMQRIGAVRRRAEDSKVEAFGERQLARTVAADGFGEPRIQLALYTTTLRTARRSAALFSIHEVWATRTLRPERRSQIVDDPVSAHNPTARPPKGLAARLADDQLQIKGDSVNERKAMKRIGRRLMVGALAAASAVAAAEATAAVDVFLKIDGIKGESQDSKHKGEMDVLSWSWGVTAPVNLQKGPAQPACASALNLMKFFDAASPLLLSNAALNTTLPSATLTVRKSGLDPLEFLVIKLDGVQVSAVQDSGSNEVPSESISLTFTKATVTYTPQLLDGKPGAEVTGNVPASCR